MRGRGLPSQISNRSVFNRNRHDVAADIERDSLPLWAQRPIINVVLTVNRMGPRRDAIGRHHDRNLLRRATVFRAVDLQLAIQFKNDLRFAFAGPTDITIF